MKTLALLILALWLGAAGFVVPCRGATTNFWFSPDGKGNGTSRERPRTYNAHYVQWGILNGGPGEVRDVTLHFLPGEYLVEPFNTTTTEPSDWRIRIVGYGRRPEDVVLKLRPGFAKGASDVGGDWVSVIDLGRNGEYLQRFELENITIDGNWTGQTNVNHPGYLRGYKNCPVYASARTGRLRRVLVRNYGAHGLVPQRTNDLSSGIEVFPIHIATEDEGQQPEDGDPRPWVVEDCEVAGFHGPYNGYAAALMGNATLNVSRTPRWAAKDSANRLLWFRRNQIRGVPGGAGVMAFGAAAHGTNISGKTTWSDNAVLNSTVFNTDTGALQQLDMTNLLALDIPVLGYVGTHSTRVPFMTEYTVSANSVRFGWALTLKDYRNYGFYNRPDGRAATRRDPSLRLGRPRFPEVTGLTVQGIAKDIRYADNWFTSRSREDFGSLDPIHPRDARFRIIHRLPSKDPGETNAPMLSRQEALDMDLSGNRISSIPFDFEEMKLIRGGRLARLSDGSSPLLEVRDALPASAGFVPIGALERVDMIFTNVNRRIAWQGVPFGAARETPRAGAFEGLDRVLIGAVEVVCGRPDPATADGNLRVPVRVAFQPTPYAGLSGTRPLPGRRVFLEVLPGSRHPQRLQGEADAQGIAVFTYAVGPNDNGVDYFRVWTDGGDGRTGEWDEYQDSWSTAHFAYGQTVGIHVVTDVADAENGRPGELRLSRTGPIDRPLTVKLRLDNGPTAAEVGRDFLLKGPSKKGYPGGKDGEASDVGNSVEFARGERELSIRVEPVTGKARSGRLVNVQIQPGDGYAPGEPPAGLVVLYAPAK